MSENPTYGRFEVGRRTYGYPKVISWNDNTSLRIGSFCSISAEVEILLGGNHRLDWISTYPFKSMFPRCELAPEQLQSKGHIVIGNDVWIGYGAMILSGVTIGNGAVIGAKSLVTRDVPAYSVACGIPAKMVRQRFTPEQIEALERISWWDWPDDRIARAVPLLLSDRIDDFINAYQ